MVKFHPTLFWLLVSMVALSPLPLGANRPWAWSLLALATGTLLIFWCLGSTIKSYGMSLPFGKVAPVMLPFFIVVFWVLFQMSGFGPEFLHHQIWQDTGSLLLAAKPGTGVGSISMNSFETGTSLMRLLSYGGVFWLAVQLGRNPRRALAACYTIAIVGAAYAFYGLVIEFTGSKTILWYQKWAYGTDLTSTFVNRNNYATYAGLGLVVTLALIYQELRTVMTKKIDIRKSLLFLLERLSLRLMILIVSVPMFITAILFTHSRAGALSVAGGVLVLFAAVTLTKAVRIRRIAGVVIIIAIASFSFFSVSGKAVSERMAEAGYSLSDRLNFYVLVMEEIKERPITGIGYGNYLDASWKIRDQSVKKHWDKAHNTYLESALELGIPSAIALFSIILITASVCLFGVRARNRNEIYPSIGLAVITIVGIHSLVDFSIQIPAVAMTFSLLLGIAYAQAWPSDRIAGDAENAPDDDEEWRPNISRRSRKRKA